MAFRGLWPLLGLSCLPLAAVQADSGPFDGLLELQCITDADTGVAACIARNRREGALALTAVVVRAPAAGYYANVVPIDRVADVEQLFEDTCAHAPASIIGGYFGEREDRTPYALGLIVSDGAQASPWAPWTVGGAITVDAANATAIRYWNEMDGVDAAEALQSKPILVDANANDGIGPHWDRANRAAFGLTDGGDLVLVGIFTDTGGGRLRAPTLKEFADYIAALRFDDGAVVERAINLDGGPSATLFVRAGAGLFGSTEERYVPAILCLGER